MHTPLWQFISSPAFLAHLADAALKSALLLLVASLIVFIQRNSSAAIRHLTWLVALLGILLLPAFSWLLPAIPVSALGHWWPGDTEQRPSTSAIMVAPSADFAGANARAVEVNAAGPTTPASLVQAASEVNAVPTQLAAPKLNAKDFLRYSVGLIWLTGMGLALAPLLLGVDRVWWMTGNCEKLSQPEWSGLLAETAASLNLRRAVRLRCSPTVKLPMTWGARRPVILLPEAAKEWTELRRRVVLRHELAHVQRWDWLTCMAAYVVCAVFWYNPLAWYAARQMRLEREQACDDLVLRRDTLPSDYAGELLQLAAGFTGRSLIDWATVPMARRSALEGRLLAILDEKRNRAGATRVSMVGAMVFAAVVIIPVAMLRAATTADATTSPAPIQSAPVISTPSAAVGSNNAAKSAPSLANPHGITMDKDGMLYVADYDLNIIFKLSPQGELSVLADHADEGGFAWPADLAVDQNKNVYVADSGRDVIRKITPDGNVTDFAGKVHIGGYTDGKGADARFHNATGIAIDATGNLYVIDNDSFIVRKITPDGTVTTIAGKPEQSGSVDGPASVALFAKPRGVGVGPDGAIYVVDEGNNNIRKIAPDGMVSTVAGDPDHKPGAQDGTWGQASFSGPRAVTVDARGNIYVADTDNNTIRKITPQHGVTTFAGKAGVAGYVDGAGVDARFNSPRGLTVDQDGNVYVADSNNAAIRKISPDGVVSTRYETIRMGSVATSPTAYTFKGALVPATNGTSAFSLSNNGTGNVVLGSGFSSTAAQAHHEAYVVRPDVVRAVIILGDVQLIDPDGKATPVIHGQTFAEGSTIKAGADSQALLVFSSTGKTMKVLQNTTVKVQSDAAIPDGTPTSRGFIQAFVVAGDVELTDKDGKATPLKRGQTFVEGNTIKAGPDAQALIVFSNGATMKVLQNSTLKVTLFRQAPFDEKTNGTFLRLDHDPSRSNVILEYTVGHIQGEVKKLNKAAGSTFLMKFPGSATASIDGGTFDYSTDPTSKSIAPAPTAVILPEVRK